MYIHLAFAEKKKNPTDYIYLPTYIQSAKSSDIKKKNTMGTGGGERKPTTYFLIAAPETTRSAKLKFYGGKKDGEWKEEKTIGEMKRKKKY